MKVRPETLREVEEALERYRTEVGKSRLRPSAKRTYLLHSTNFVRWLDDDFEPGGSLEPVMHFSPWAGAAHSKGLDWCDRQ